MLETENFSLTGKVETGLGHLEVLENQDHHRQPEQQHQHTVSKPIIRPTHYSANGLFGRRIIWPTDYSADGLYGRRIIRPTDFSADRFFGRPIIWPTDYSAN